MVAQNNRIPWIFVTNRFGCLVWLQDSLKAVLVLWCCSANGRNSPQVCPKTQPDAGEVVAVTGYHLKMDENTLKFSQFSVVLKTLLLL
ncbi:hypothetical protein L2E82_30710 [Cichorium intybus]|uniref:Uncharacterized protein n=1 Tax=Cichorium intybus TaxID=13427 RepID=A0ACB9D145_CICIN|nr:hypothetical protein L2E82_30710 [Cichorium intybus]